MLTDYGTTDEFVGVLHAVVARDAPGAPVVDLSHHVASFDVTAGARALVRCWPHLGPGVVVAVVDPGVGTQRRAVAVAVAGDGPNMLVGPDNGLLGGALALAGGAVDAVELPRPEGAPVTFDGRDVFAPAGARLWAGAPLRSLGAAIDPATLATLPPPRCRVGTATLDAEVLWVDRFGNVQLAATAADGAAAGLSGEVEVRVADKTMPARRVDTFGELAPGELGLLVDGNGHLAVACNREAAATVLGVTAGDDVAVTAGRAP